MITAATENRRNNMVNVSAPPWRAMRAKTGMAPKQAAERMTKRIPRNRRTAEQ